MNEANAIGTAYLRAQLLPLSVRRDVQKSLQRDLDLRVKAGRVVLDDEADRQILLTWANETLDALIVVLAFIIIDLDRPRRGLIRVDQRNLEALQVAVDAAESSGDADVAPDLPRPAVTGRR